MDTPRRSLGKDLASIAAARVVVSAGVWLTGFRAISDDDYSRVVIAQEWARAPKLDPSGTSWLPFPFWLNGAAMLAFGRSLFVAQAVAIALGVLSSWLVYAAAMRITGDRRSAFVSGVFATLVGWSSWLGPATVPELSTAALTLFAASTLASRSSRDRGLGALALVGATLSRYEPWPVAIAFAAWNTLEMKPPEDLSARGTSIERDEPDGEGPLPERSDSGAIWEGRTARSARSAGAPAGGGHPPSRIVRFAISIVALLGPVAWIVWNRVAHGEAMHFVSRVTAYRKALGEGVDESVIARLVAYPVALAREMPEVIVPFIAFVALAISFKQRSIVLDRLRAHRTTLVLAVVQIVALALALVKDGAPTHHPERAVLFPALAMVVLVADAASRLTANIRPIVPLVIALGLMARAIAIPVTHRDAFAKRDSEVAVGALVRAKTRPDQRVMIEATDYGYFAIEAASGRPEVFELDRDLDPRHPRPPPDFEDPKEYAEWLRRKNIAYLVSPLSDSGPVRLRFERGIVMATARHTLSEVPAPD